MEMLDETGIPSQPDNPRDFKKSAVKGAALGFLLAAAWTALLVVTRKTVRKEDDIHKWMHTRCLGAVPELHEKRRTESSQVRKVVTDSKIDEKFLESFRMIRNKVEYHAHAYHMKTNT